MRRKPDDLDRELERRGHKFARYADDFVIMVKSERAGDRVKASITRFLKKKLKLRVNQDKGKVGNAKKCAFLGFTFPGRIIKWVDKKFDEFMHELRKLTARSWRISFSNRIEQLNRYIHGWMAYFLLSKILEANRTHRHVATEATPRVPLERGERLRCEN